jgi:hypothetical protein
MKRDGCNCCGRGAVHCNNVYAHGGALSLQDELCTFLLLRSAAYVVRVLAAVTLRAL